MYMYIHCIYTKKTLSWWGQTSHLAIIVHVEGSVYTVEPLNEEIQIP